MKLIYGQLRGLVRVPTTEEIGQAVHGQVWAPAYHQVYGQIVEHIGAHTT